MYIHTYIFSYHLACTCYCIIITTYNKIIVRIKPTEMTAANMGMFRLNSFRVEYYVSIICLCGRVFAFVNEYGFRRKIMFGVQRKSIKKLLSQETLTETIKLLRLKNFPAVAST